MEYADKIDKIVRVLESYKTTIETKNKCGLFDSATLYELFAVRICAMWFGQEFYNLNSGKANAAYVDLVSKDNSIYIQVSTTQDIPRKIKNTLSKIADNKIQSSLEITRLYFFVLDNESLKRVKDYSGEQRFGKIEFNKDENLITLERIIERAKQDYLFLDKLFAIVDDEANSLVNLEKLADAVDTSKNLLNSSIETKINGEYSIDRSELINRIIADNNRFISVQGTAGVGKSALCKELLDGEDRVLYVRAERFIHCNNLNDIFNIDIDKVLYYLHGQKIVFYIDALEFIADGLECNIDLLKELYIKANKYDNVYIYNTCRTIDSKRFVKLDEFFCVKVYLVEALNKEEIRSVTERYDTLKCIIGKRDYKSLLGNPFYINLIVSKGLHIDKLEEVSDIRDSIWNEIICCGDNDLKTVVKEIVIERARNGLIGIDPETVKGKHLKKLQSEGIITVCPDNSIRLKYDIFEDICFEQIIDKEFRECKGIYKHFFSKLEQLLGRYAYRRYQIWVENKLLIKTSSDRFLYKIISELDTDEKWFKYTVIGIISSKHCKEFFVSYENIIVEKHLEYFIKLTNTHCFELNIVDDNDKIIGIRPIGSGRVQLINLIAKYNKYFDELLENEIGKLCLDYSQYNEKENTAAVNACVILEYIVDKKLEQIKKERIYADEKEIADYLIGIYLMSLFAGNWIKKLWKQMVSLYFDGDNHSRYLAQQIMLFTLKNAACIQDSNHIVDIIKIADSYWLKTPSVKRGVGVPEFHDSYDINADFGLSRRAKSYNYEFQSPLHNQFLIYLLSKNWTFALKWIVKTLNYAAENYKNNFSNDVKNIVLWNKNDENEKNYIFASCFVKVGRIEYVVPELLGDSIYFFSKWFVENIKKLDDNERHIACECAEIVKKYILEHSNNVMAFNIILQIGVGLKDIIPGYAKELASSIDFLLGDQQVIITKCPGYKKILFKKNMMSNLNNKFGINSRYGNRDEEIITLQDYILESQFLVNDSVKSDIESMLDWMYSKYPNENHSAKEHLNIQKMDLRQQIAYMVDDRLTALVANVEGDVKKLTESHNEDPIHLEMVKCSVLCEKVREKIAEVPCNIEDCKEILKELVNFTNTEFSKNLIDKELVDLSLHLLSENRLDKDTRLYLCSIMLEFLQNNIDEKSFSLTNRDIKVLLDQYDIIDSELLKCKMKELILRYLMYEQSNGIILEIRRKIKDYLRGNKKLAKAMFNTICNLAIDKISEYKYVVTTISSDDDYKYKPNFTKPPSFYKHCFEEQGLPLYQSKEKEIINNYLLEEECFDASILDIHNSSMHILSFAADSGLTLADKDYRHVMDLLFKYVVKAKSGKYDYREFLGFLCADRIVQSLNWELSYGDNDDRLMEVLFDGIDFNYLNYASIEDYDGISNGFICRYLDEYDNQLARKQIENKIRLLEKRISEIVDIEIRKELFSMLFLCRNFGFGGDLTKITTSFSFNDKIFVNELWSKYGQYHIKNFLTIIYQFHIEALLPEILPAVYESLSGAKSKNYRYSEILLESRGILIKFIRCAFMNYRDTIHEYDEYTKAYEGILEILGDEGLREATALLDEFRIH